MHRGCRQAPSRPFHRSSSIFLGACGGDGLHARDDAVDSPPFTAYAYCRDKRVVTDLVASVTRWRRRLDYIIEACSGR